MATMTTRPRDLLVVSTCGTSLFTNGAAEDERKWLTSIANLAGPDLAPADAARLDQLVRARREAFAAADEDQRRRRSAELNGIGAVLGRWPARQVAHQLIHTDTAIGRAAAAIVRDTLRAAGQQAELVTAGGLRTDDLAGFREALADITRQIDATVPGYARSGWRTVFNLTGGFKSVNAYLQSLGMLHADHSVFLFEGSAALMEIPRLPIRLAEADEMRAHLHVFRRLAVGYAVSADDVGGIPEALILLDGDTATTSVWGDVVWQRVRPVLLAERLLEPLSPKLSVDPSVDKGFGAATPEHRVQVNEALDELSAHLDGRRPLLKSRTFKPLRGDPVPPSTHELYAWSDGAAGRLFGRYVDGGFHVDALGSHL